MDATTERRAVVKRDKTVMLDGATLGRVAYGWVTACGYLWIAYGCDGARVGVGATRREAVAALIAATDEADR